MLWNGLHYHKHSLSHTHPHTHTCEYTHKEPIRFEEEPKNDNVDVEIGTNAFFPCKIVNAVNNQTIVPKWRVTQPNCRNPCIESRDTDCCMIYSARELPYQYTNNGSGLIVQNVNAAMDGSLYACCEEIFFEAENIFRLICSRNGEIYTIGKHLG